MSFAASLRWWQMARRNHVGLNAKWEDLNTQARWRAWLDLAMKQAPDAAEWWSDDTGCSECVHFDVANVWCGLYQKAFALGLKKSTAYLAEHVGDAHYFHKTMAGAAPTATEPPPMPGVTIHRMMG